MISGNVPYHLVAGAKAGFLQAVKDVAPLWQQVAMVANLDGKTLDLVDLGAAPMPKESKTGMTVQDFVEKHKEVKPRDWDITVYISYNAIKDDRIGDLERRVRAAGSNFNKHLNSLVFTVLNAGDGTTYGTCYDGLALFSNSHVDGGANYQTVQDNLDALSLTLDNFNTVYQALATVRDDQGEYTAYTPNLLIVPPALKYTASQISTNREAYDTGNREINPFAGEINHIVVPWFDSTAWVLMDSTSEIKPIIVAMREQPNLQDAWFDPSKPDGGWYMFKFYARYDALYGAWQPAHLGNT
jgi:phage major head subunit gpT-like protein